MNLLRIAARIFAVPVESKIRHEDRSNKFDLNKFKSLSSDEMLSYAKERLEQLGEGSSRVVFSLTSSKVLKIAKPRDDGSDAAGMAQNEGEVDVYTNSQTKSVTAKIYSADPEYKWLISEAVRPISSDSEFESKMDSSLEMFSIAVRCLADGMTVDEAYDESIENHEYMYLEIDANEDETFKLNKDKLEVVKNLIDVGMEYVDFLVPGHWGVTSSGNIVILDYGLTTGVWEEFYLENTGSGFGQPSPSE